MPYRDTVDLTNCDREPIHIPGSIQPHGCLIACDAAGSVVMQHSANVADMLAITGEINGQRLEDIVGGEAAHTLRNALATSDNPARPALRHGLKFASGAAFDVSIHRFESKVILEFEPASTDSDQPLEVARMLISRIRNVASLDRLIESSVRLIYAMLGYDRVMIYRFEEDGAGKVVSEYKRRDLESFKGQYFPAGDIPKQARALYVKNTIRVISDASNPRIPIVPETDETGEALDLSFAHLRSVSPIHCEYLRNMGVAASMSISVVVDNELWGLIACHHYSPKILSMPQRVAAETFGEFFSLHLSALRQRQLMETAGQARRSLDRFLQAASHHADITALLRSSLAEFGQMLACDGIGLWLGGVLTGEGAVPPQDRIAELAEFVGGVAGGKIWSSFQLSTDLPEIRISPDMVCGVLAIPLSQRPRDYLFFFRREMVETLNWAGNPEKSYETGPLGDRLTPRKSFAIWREMVHRQAQPWSDSDREIADAIRAVLVEVVLHHNELLADERGKADVRQRMLNEELNHRVKNILSVIKALVGHSVDAEVSLKDYIGSLKGRIQALAFAHDQVVRGGDGGGLSDLLEAELKPYSEGTRSVTLKGPRVWLDSRAFSVMALVLHEMSTNAAKYGSLSVNGGRLDIEWRRLANNDCELVWTENGGPLVSPPFRAGFGSVLITRSVPYELEGEAKIEYPPEGVRARFVVPSKHIHGDEELADVEAEESGSVVSHDAVAPRLQDLEFLLVEDQMLIAADVEAMLADHGIDKVTTTPSAADAFRKLEDIRFDVAILDVNLGSGTSLPIAEELIRRNIPFIFATGYSDKAIIPASFSAPVVRKPYEAAALISAVTKVLSERS
ncbi:MULTISPECIES: HWE histidine kinase domain-containing protein [unclassified Neorhizobium]|uniref:HWE histidine kinase domain-containing protein n=1 Tax=unclassified Neorhizobium TaxID=2629175 RepID=UPI001FF60817|nr:MULTISPECIES: HWE histidine kinase domain-containing protein [unclassified Neorhizobium]MCJ9671784.1 GAF domain-containing protein [Neorhizobium sp. SHOUNA12B]MCJ9747860.1 GAF domain-containing protein [Neorhizobium sp. SHOUNA12A]